MTEHITVSRELLRQLLDAIMGVVHGEHLISDMLVVKAVLAARAALEQPAVEGAKLGAEWTPCMKLPVVVHVRKQRPGEQHVSTREGITPVKPDDLIMRGVSGEEYPIGRAIFDQTYTLDVQAPQAQPIPLAATCHCACVVEDNKVVEFCKMHGTQQPRKAVKPALYEALKLYTAPQAQQPAVEPVQTLIAKLQSDPDYAWSWHCNIAMAYVDAGGDPYTGNQGAARFMKMFANVDPAHELPPPADVPLLTDDEIYEMYSEPRSDAEMLAFGREVEQAVRQKAGLK